MAALSLDLATDPRLAQLPDRAPLVVFDSDCILCSRSMRILNWLDRKRLFRLTPAQGELGTAIYQALHMPSDNYETFLLVEQSKAWGKSDAILQMIRRLDWPWRAMGIFAIIPRPLRDALYMLIARNRYRVFGRKKSCGLNIKSLSDRMI